MTAHLALAASVALQAVITASLGLSLNEADSLLMLVFAASACMLCGALTIRGVAGGPVWPWPTAAPLISLNVWTAVSFISFFLGVAIHSAAVVFTLEASFAPLGVIGWAMLGAHGPQPRPLPAQCWAASLLAALGVSLVTVIAASDSGGTAELLGASALGVLAGVAAGRVAHISRDLGRSGVGVTQVMAHRFYLTTIVAVTVLLTLVPSELLAPPALQVGVTGAAALASVVAPMYLLQYSMQRLEPAAVTGTLATMPAIAIAVEFLSGRPVSWMVLLLGALLVPGNFALLTLTREKRVKPPGTQSLQIEMEHQ